MNRYKVLVVTIAKSRYTMALTTPHWKRQKIGNKVVAEEQVSRK